MSNVIQAPQMSMLAPDLQAQQVALQRQQQMADMLRQQGISPIETGQMVTGAGPARAIPITGMQALAKLLQSGLGAYMQNKNDAQSIELGKQMNDRINMMADQTMPPDGSQPQQVTPTQPSPPPQQVQQAAAIAAALRAQPNTTGEGWLNGPQDGQPAPQDPIQQVQQASQPQAGASAQPQVPPPPSMSAALRSAVRSARLIGNFDLANKLTEQAWSAYAPTDATKMANAGGVDPRQANIDALKKSNYIAPTSLRPGGIAAYADGKMEQMPAAIEGSQAVKMPDGTWAYRPNAGGVEAISSAESAKLGGRNTQTLTSTDQLPVDDQGRPIPKTISQTIADAQPVHPQSTAPAVNGLPASYVNAVMSTESGGNPAAVSPKGAAGAMQVMPSTATNPGFGVAPAKDNSPQELQRVGAEYLGALHSKYNDPTLTAIAYNMGPAATDKWIAAGGDYSHLPAETKNYVSSVMTKTAVANAAPKQQAAQQGVGLALGQKEGAQAAQAELSKKFSDLNDANRSAQTTNSYLQNIRSLADKAGAGGFSDKVQFTNNLLSYAGISDKATDEVTAKNLLDKYSNQITARLGGGSNGSDARSAIIQSAYPNSHMTPAAIKEAVDNLVGANDMVKAKATVLSPHANARDPVAYQQKEQVFDQNADPRIWQWKSISNPAMKKQFAATVMQQDPNFPQKIKALESIGAFQ